MITPDELLEKLHTFEDTSSGIAVYKQAAGIVKLYREVMNQAADMVRSGLELDGVTHHKDDLGSAGWTEPKAAKLDRARWAAAIAQDPDLKAIQDEADRAAALLEDARDRAGCMVMPEPRFFIR